MAYNGLFICYFLYVVKKRFGTSSRFDQGIVCYILEVSDSLTYTCYLMCACM